MKVILIKNIKDKGKINDIINVSDGYAKNYLIRKGFAIATNIYSLAKLNNILSKQVIQEKKIITYLENLKLKLEKITLNFKLKVFYNKTFGSISLINIKNKLFKEFNLKIDKKKIINNNNLSNVGLYYLKIKLSKNIIASLKVIIEKG